jgi:hypothetical protein
MTSYSAIQIQAMVRNMDESFRKYRNLKDSNPTLWSEKMRADNKVLLDEFPTVFNMHMNGKLDQTFFDMLHFDLLVVLTQLYPHLMFEPI